MERFIKLANGEVINHGDKIYAIITFNDDQVHVDGRLSINKVAPLDRLHFICQNYFDGDSRVEDKFNYRYSWSFALDENGVIVTGDTIAISHNRLDEEEEPEQDGAGYTEDDRTVDDDPMPDDWTPEEKLPQDL